MHLGNIEHAENYDLFIISFIYQENAFTYFIHFSGMLTQDTKIFNDVDVSAVHTKNAQNTGKVKTHQLFAMFIFNYIVSLLS